MLKMLRPLAATAAALGVAYVGALAVTPDNPAPAKPVDPPAAAKPAASGELKYAVDPKPLSEPILKGLKWLAKQQNSDGGWSQGGGWRTGAQGGGRVEGQEVSDPSDVGNTCMALLALLRAGNTPTEGEYKENVSKGLKYICDQVGKSKSDDLYVTEVRNTQLQSKIGPYVDTFLSALVLAEMKGKAGPEEKALVAALDKTITKMAKHQKDDGTFAGNGGWAPVLSQGVANKAVARARLNGFAVPEQVFARAMKQSQDSVNGAALATSAGTTATAGPTGGPLPAGGLGRGAGGIGGFGGGGRGDAGVPLYGASQAAGNIQDVVNSVKKEADEAKRVKDDPKATEAQKRVATEKLASIDALEKDAAKAQRELSGQIRDGRFVAGFGSNGGEEFLSFLNIGESLVVRGCKDWQEWDKKMQDIVPKAQDKDGSWSGHHCITGKTFCTSGALLVLMADRTQFPAEVIKAARDDVKKSEEKKDEKKPEEKK